MEMYIKMDQQLIQSQSTSQPSKEGWVVATKISVAIMPLEFKVMYQEIKALMTLAIIPAAEQAFPDVDVKLVFVPPQATSNNMYGRLQLATSTSKVRGEFWVVPFVVSDRAFYMRDLRANIDVLERLTNKIISTARLVLAHKPFCGADTWPIVSFDKLDDMIGVLLIHK